MSQRGRPFETGNTFGQGRPPGSRNKKSLLLQELLLDAGEEILQTVIDRAKKGDRAALALCMERLVPRLKEVAELPVEQSQEDPQLTTNHNMETHQLDYSKLTEEEFNAFEHLVEKMAPAHASGSESGAGVRTDAPESAEDRPSVPGYGPAAA
jgi:hypothetical protein